MSRPSIEFLSPAIRSKAALMLLLCLAAFNIKIHAQGKHYRPVIEKSDGRFMIDSEFIKGAPQRLKAFYSVPFPRIDSSFNTTCGYLVVPENRSRPGSGMVRLPFIILRSKNPHKHQDPLLYTAGGPGGSSLSWIQGMTKGDIIKDRDCIAFEQRGTRYALPHLRSFELDEAIKDSYRKNLNKDSMVLVGLRKYRQALIKRGIDLEGYNTDETVADIHDLLTVLGIDSVNLYGNSYSGGLMTAVLEKDPGKVRSLVLDSPLPLFVPIDEDEPVNFHEALQTLFRRVSRDSVSSAYSDLSARFISYFNKIADSTFYIRYQDSDSTLKIAYTKVELLSEIMSAMSDNMRRRDVARIVSDMISGRHEVYVRNFLDELFRKNQAPDGMRISVYCADQSEFHSPGVVKDIYRIFPYLLGYHINDVTKPMCDCWNVPAVKLQTKQPYYSLKPVLLGDGEMDPNCRPLYMQRLAHYMPAAQSFLFLNRGHGVAGRTWFRMTRDFLNHPEQKLRVSDPNVVAY